MAFVIAAGLLAAWRFRSQLGSLIRRFFLEADEAFNLAIFRIVFYSTAISLLGLPESQVKRFAELPSDLISPPSGMGYIGRHLPLSAGLVQVAYTIFVVSAVFAAIGLFTRLASFAFLVSGGYYLTVPQLFGKVSHYHIVIWVAAILAFSRTADVWSLDSVLRARRDALRGRPLVPSPARAYSRPLRLTWLFLALCYVGPGFWKYRTDGLQWASPTNMRGILYDKWFELGGFRPFIPVEKSAVLLSLGALTTLFFETSFVFLIWHRYTRLLAAAMGLFFHTMTWVLMRIGFWSNVVLYVSFVDWYRLSRAFFIRQRTPLLFAYDGGCGSCRTIATMLARLALPGGVEFRSAQDAVEAGLVGGARLTDMLSEIHLFAAGTSFRGFAAYRRLAWRVPVLWPFLILFYLPAGAWAGRRLYALVSARRTCNVKPIGEPATVDAATPGSAWTAVPTVIGALIIAIGFGAIATNRENAWPVALYPTFAGLTQPMVQQLRIAASKSDGTTTNVSLRSCYSWLPSDRYVGLVNNAVGFARAGHPQVLRSLLGAASHPCGDLDASDVVALSFYADTVVTTQGEVGRVVKRQLLLREPIA